MKKIIYSAISALLAAAIFAGCAENKEEYEAYSYTSAETISSVSIDVRDRVIEVSPSEDGKVHIDCFESGKERCNISVSEDGALTMTIAESKEWSDYIGVKAPSDARKITLKVPDGDLNLLSIFTTNEDITLAPVNVGSVTLGANGGSILFEKLNAESSVTLEAKNGNIGGTIVGGYDDYSVSCSIKKGKSNLPEEKDDGIKKLVVSVNNGDIDVNFVKNQYMILTFF